MEKLLEILNEISMEDRDLKEAIKGTMREIVKENMKVIENIKEEVSKIKRETPIKIEIFLDKKEDSKILEKNGLYPVISNEIIDILENTDPENSLEKINTYILENVYYKGTYIEINEILSKDFLYEGKIFYRDGRDESFKYKLLLNRDFKNIENELKEVFYKNRVEWRPYYSSYTRKILRVKIIEGSIVDRDMIEKIEYHTDKISREYIPYWNVRINRNVELERNPTLTSLENEFKILLPSSLKEKCLLDSNKIDHITSITSNETNKEIKYIGEKINSSITSYNITEIFDKSNKDITYMADNISNYIPRSEYEVKKILEDYKISKNHSFKITREAEKNFNRYSEDFKYDWSKNNFLNRRLKISIRIKFQGIEEDIYSDDVKNYYIAVLEYYYPEIFWYGE